MAAQERPDECYNCVHYLYCKDEGITPHTDDCAKRNQKMIDELEYPEESDEYGDYDDDNDDPCEPCRLFACEYWGGDGICLLEIQAMVNEERGFI